MTSYYNENDPYAAQWLRNLIKEGLIAPGEVDERSVADVQADDLSGYTQCHFFAGIGGWSYALRLAGWPDTRPVWTGSCPCQPFSAAGKQKGFADDRHLWPVFRNLIEVGRPSIVFGEQVASAAQWLRLVRSDLEALGYAVGAMPIQAASAGADHLRDRYWFVANTDAARSQGRQLLSERAGERSARSDGLADAASAGPFPGTHTGIYCQQESAGPRHVELERHGRYGLANGKEFTEREPANATDAVSTDRQARALLGGDSLEWVIGADGKARRVKSGVRLLAHGVSGRVGKLRGFGNAIDPRPAGAFIKAAHQALNDNISFQEDVA